MPRAACGASSRKARQKRRPREISEALVHETFGSRAREDAVRLPPRLRMREEARDVRCGQAGCTARSATLLWYEMPASVNASGWSLARLSFLENFLWLGSEHLLGIG